MENTEIIARKITEMIADESYHLFRDKKFRRLNNFEKIDQVEQDRIFNEIVVSGLALAVLMFEALAELNSENRKDLEQLFLNLKVETTSYYGNWLKEMGTEVEFADLWKGLIEMRCDEYHKDRDEYLKDIKIKANPWKHIVSIGGFRHITRGKGKAEDELFKIFIHWIDNISKQITKILLKQI